ncbi:hypothetical protein L226DRAFT_191420 [Lentinus tigrinus ALCF2SS1-7]|uniref:uncharacterized protein n=1 Tax=Lentinus tigrinus ALCF2SS1-7 TaxID=1328758 RepID=UPI001165E643|nr:hypothetical protein L226DRAFT_191420 [Lentinus tigrinus ALCF2SS1-7]
MLFPVSDEWRSAFLCTIVILVSRQSDSLLDHLLCSYKKVSVYMNDLRNARIVVESYQYRPQSPGARVQSLIVSAALSI